MAKKGRESGKRRAKKRNNKKKDHTRIVLLSLACLLLVLVIAVILLYARYKVKYEAYTPAEPPEATSKPLSEKAHIEEEYGTREDIPGETKPRQTYKVAIVIDDLGCNDAQSEELLKIDIPLTFSVFPLCRYSASIAQKAHAMGRDVMLHLPMEPYEYPEKNPGNGTLFLHMSNEKLLRKLGADIRSVPFIKGVNNHMGSRFTEDEEKMRVVLEELKERGLFFLDSRTSRNSVGYSMAKEMGVKAVGRDIFLDNNPDVESINAQIYKLARCSMKNGSAIGIGHPHPSTIEALKQSIPELKRKGIEVVPVSQLVN